MKRSKGLNADEKAQLIENFITKNPQPYTFKEIESISRKVIPTSMQSSQIQEIVELLVSEFKLKALKVGILTLYWPTKVFLATGTRNYAEMHSQLSLLIISETERLSKLQILVKRLESELQQFREDHFGLKQEEYDSLFVSLRNDEHNLKILLKQKESAIRCDPVTYYRLCTEQRRMRENVNQWVDNVFILSQHVQARANISHAEFRNLFSLPCDFDYI